MTSPDLFWAVFAAVLGACLLAGTFFWGMAAYTRLERDGREKGEDGLAPLIAIALPLIFLAMALFTALRA